ncbi:MAG: FAD-dependent oxidoreductase [Rhodospirillales bacterium]|nr:FAD-dependent oxidoreductase [Rhodospirillales bacterium]
MTLPAAVVIGAGVNGLGVVRSLAAGGVPVHLLDADPSLPAMRTRRARVGVVPRAEGEPLIAALLALRAELGPAPVLFPTLDESVETLSRSRARLGDCRLRLPPQEVLDALVTKNGFQELAERHGARVPAAVRVRDVADLESLGGLRYPCAVKPDVHTPAYDARFAKAYRVDTADEARRLCEAILEVMPGIVVQEWIQGDDSEIYFCLQYRNAENRSVASFTGRKIRAWPREIGATASCVPAPEAAAALEEATEQFFGRLRVVGMCGMEYKRDRRDGRYYMVEPTVGRTDAQEEVATLNGVNIPLAAYAEECGLPAPRPVAPRRPVMWMRDALAEFQARRAGPVVHGPPAGSRLVDGLWRAADPLPALAAYPVRATEWIVGRMSRRLSQRSR